MHEPEFPRRQRLVDEALVVEVVRLDGRCQALAGNWPVGLAGGPHRPAPALPVAADA